MEDAANKTNARMCNMSLGVGSNPYRRLAAENMPILKYNRKIGQGGDHKSKYKHDYQYQIKVGSYVHMNARAWVGLIKNMRYSLSTNCISTPVKTLADMTPEQIAGLEQRYNCKVKQ